jgi:hypothetical protein
MIFRLMPGWRNWAWFRMIFSDPLFPVRYFCPQPLIPCL